MQKFPTIKDHRLPGAVAIVAGLGLALAPWGLGFAAVTAAAWNAWIVGLAAAVIAGAMFYSFHRAGDWAILALGIWALVAPWLLGFAAQGGALWAHVAAGLVIAAAAAASLWATGDRPVSTA